MYKKHLNIKNMVCPRCVTAVENSLTKLGYSVCDIGLGFAEVEGHIDLDNIANTLKENGFELILDKNEQLVSKIKSEIINLVHYQLDNNDPHRLSDILSKKLDKDYAYLTAIFSASEDYTIERYYILQRIEKVKEYLIYNELSLKEIAFKLGYSSTAHLSAQFKKEVGCTPSQFKENKNIARKNLDEL